jgi:hypothetical protein
MEQYEFFPVAGRPPRNPDPEPDTESVASEYDFDDYSSVSSQEGDDDMDPSSGLTNRERRQVESDFRGLYPEDFENAEDENEDPMSSGTGAAAFQGNENDDQEEPFSDSDTDSIQLGDMEGDMEDERGNDSDE